MNHPKPSELRRGCSAQQDRRELERSVRTRAVAFRRWASRRGLSRTATAERLGVAPSTLGQWDRGWRTDRLRQRLRGRPCRRSDFKSRNEVIHWIADVGPHTGLPTLQATFPVMARGELVDLQRRFRRLHALANPITEHELIWHQPGSVWAMDHAEPPLWIDGVYPHILAVRDLASGQQLGWLPVFTETAAETMDVLRALFIEHGPPLVMKSDNGSPFIAEDTKALLKQFEVAPLFSPPLTPSYNGSCEAGIGAAKVRTRHEAARHGRWACWSSDDLEAAHQAANTLNRPWGYRGPTPEEVWQCRSPITAAERLAFACSVDRYRIEARETLGHQTNQHLGHHDQATVDRVSLRRALVAHDILTVTRRSAITQPINP